MRRWYAVILLALMAGGLATPATAEKRVALVVGNNSYASLPASMQLRNAVSDARAMRDTLQGLGFDVLYGENLDRRALVERLFDLTARLSPGDVAFFFFAGHGVSLSGANYLLPTDVPAPRATGRAEEGRLAELALAESQIIDRLAGAGARVAIVVLDACRDNPLQTADRRSVGITRGLAEKVPPRGIFSIYSAGFGQAALDRLGDDDRHPNSVFTRVFVEKLKTPGLELRAVAQETRRTVATLAERAGHDQFPAYYDQIVGGDIYLAGPPRGASQEASPAPAPARSEDAVFWSTIRESKVAALFEEFLRQFPNSPHAGEARARLRSLQSTAVVAPPVAPPVPQETRPQPTVGTLPPSSVVANPLNAAQERQLKPKSLFKECPTCPEMVVVPAGEFIMGSPSREEGRDEDEGPLRRVTLQAPFAVGRFAVTFEEWDTCVADGGCNRHRPSDQGWGRGRRPVINVSWGDTQAYVAWLSQKTGKTYRLLTEAEREYVTRAGTRTPFWWGSTITTDQANYDGNYSYRDGPRGQARQQTVPVDSFGPNPFGLYQVHGNVWEWAEDCWNETLRATPADGSASTDGDCSRRVLRGGAWLNGPALLRPASRDSLPSSESGRHIGFRVARTVAF